MLRWLTIRRVYQLFFLLLFFALLFSASYARHWRFPVSLFLELDPLIAITTALASGVVFSGLALSLILVVITLVFGRVFCSWVCPLGILNHLLSALPAGKKRREKVKQNQWRGIYQTKYYLLLALLVLSAFGVNQVGLLDPISLVVRGFALTVFPGLQLAGAPIYANQPTYLGGWLVGAMLLLVLGANLFISRLWCRMLCPLGALLGILARFSLFRIYRDKSLCVDCERCAGDCHGACDPFGKIRVSDCVMCLNCLYACKKSGVHYGFLPSPEGETSAPDLQRRKTIAALASGIALVPLMRTSHGVMRGADPNMIRPPGSLPEVDFAGKCIKCGACMRVCPTGVLQPAGLQAGIEGLWTPILRYDVGFCSDDCTLCSQVCPTGAIAPLTPRQRLGLPPAKTPVKLGTAFYDRGRCLPWAMATPCIVCEEVCPVSPKAIWLEDAEVRKQDGNTVKVKLPYVDPTRCIGCGTCQFRCPVGGKAAIRVSSVGETRSPDNQMLLSSY